MKFQYSPGLIGYGAKGADGSAGVAGLGMYFTDINPITDFIRLRAAIQNDEVLWSTAVPGTKLPSGRQYQSGDLIVDTRGFVYEIDASSNTYEDTGASLNKSQIFETNEETSNDPVFTRYFNIDGSGATIIDTAFSNNPGLNYSLYPSTIYGISPLDFARIEHSDVIDGSYNAFTLYSSGVNSIVDDQMSLAIVREVNSNIFHIGNIDISLGLIRNTNLVLDFSLLRQTKNAGNLFNLNTLPGTFLTNSEKNTNLLFSPAFNIEPLSFYATPGTFSVSIQWNLLDFTSDTSIIASLYFYQKQGPLGSYDLNASVARPIVLHNIEQSGSVTINTLGLGTSYGYYIKIEKNGWERSSIIKSITTGNLPSMIVLNPASLILSADASGWFASLPGYIYGVDINTVSPTGWYASSPNSWITIANGSGPTSGAYTFDVSLLRNTSITNRIGTINIFSEAPPVSITINQAQML